MSNLASPLSKGLFQRAINESGTRIAVTRPETALKAGADFAAAAGCTDQSTKCLRALSVEQVLNNQAPIVRYVSDFPSIDGTVITRAALDAFSQGAFNRVPILTGLVQDEQSFFMPELNTKKPLTTEEFNRYAASFGAPHTEKLLQKYPLSAYPSPSLAEIAMAQGSKACTARLLNRNWAKYVPVFSYEFRDQTAPSYFPETSYPMKAYHTAELQFLFPMFRGGQGTAKPLSAAQEKLSDEMVDYWTSFARTGVPRAKPANAATSWPRYSEAKDNVKYLDLAGSKVTDRYGEGYDCALWDGILSYK
jgi:para-nitrobenzyl esterase